MPCCYKGKAIKVGDEIQFALCRNWYRVTEVCDPCVVIDAKRTTIWKDEIMGHRRKEDLAVKPIFLGKAAFEEKFNSLRELFPSVTEGEIVGMILRNGFTTDWRKAEGD